MLKNICVKNTKKNTLYKKYNKTMLKIFSVKDRTNFVLKIMLKILVLKNSKNLC